MALGKIDESFFNDKVDMEIPPNVVASWVLIHLRETMGVSMVRHAILRSGIGSMKGVTFGKDLLTPEDWATYEKTLTETLSASGIVLFTASNLPDATTGETHFQTFLVNPTAKYVLMIDPARKPTGAEGIYAAYASTENIKPFYEKQGFRVEWVLTKTPCQIKEEDVFCQSWSLYLLIETLKNEQKSKNNRVNIIPIPRTQKEKYTVLLEFFKQCLQIPQVCAQLQREWTEFTTKKSSWDEALFQGVKTAKNKTEIKKVYAGINPCDFIQKMTVDLMQA